MLKRYFTKKRKCIDAWLDDTLIGAKTYPALIHESMRYMVLNGGKRIRPILAIACCEACGGHQKDIAIPAVAIELIHTYSLIHDDLPCMDNDDYRRNQPTCHKKYGEAFALLAGDGLLTYAFELLSKLRASKQTMRIIRTLSHDAGTVGMIGGQVVDKLSENKTVTLPLLDYINVHKTGKLITASCLIGAIAANARPQQEKKIKKYGEYLGFAFQVVDDIIDNNGYLRFMSKHEALCRAEELVQNAKHAIRTLGQRAQILNHIADFVLHRGNRCDEKKNKAKKS
ncbi:MAG: polyprenyl synthetase family protein [Candidatus Omnitrophica bacterium]|nr:polyprenyl synthetase family protein [Candidatus Omnitrophota bacterium]